MDSSKHWEKCYQDIRTTTPLIWPDVQAVRLLSLAKLEKGVKVLEVACGEGRNSRLLLESGYNLTVVEQSQAALNIVKRLYDIPSEKMICNDVFAAIKTLAAEKFELIFCWGLIHFIDRPKELLDDLSRLLTNNNKLIISFTADEDNCDRVEGINTFYTEEKVRTLLTQCGFNINALGLQTSHNLLTNKKESFYWALATKNE